MSLTDAQVVEAIQKVAQDHGLVLERRQSAGLFYTVDLSAPAAMPRHEQRSLLVTARNALVQAGIFPSAAELTRYDNPPFYNRYTGKTDAGHPRHGDPLLVIESVWWVTAEQTA